MVATASTCVLLDCGFSLKETVSRLARLDLCLEDLDAVLCTHEHSDHAKGVAPLARKSGIPLFMTQGTWLARDYGEVPDLQLIKNYEAFALGDLHIQPVAVPHDAREPAQFVFSEGSKRLGVLTDLGCVTPHIIAAYAECDALLLEANHDLDMLWEGPYPPSLKSRVASDWGHLNNQQALQLLESLISPRLQTVVLGHISQKNNHLDRVRAAVDGAGLVGAEHRMHYACQDEGFAWLEL